MICFQVERILECRVLGALDRAEAGGGGSATVRLKLNGWAVGEDRARTRMQTSQRMAKMTERTRQGRTMRPLRI